MKNYIQKGDVLDITLGATVSSGDLILVGSLVGVCASDGVSGDVIAVYFEGVFEVAKLGTDAPAAGTKLYFDEANNRVTVTPGAGPLPFAGYAAEAAANGDATVKIKLAN